MSVEQIRVHHQEIQTAETYLQRVGASVLMIDDNPYQIQLFKRDTENFSASLIHSINPHDRDATRRWQEIEKVDVALVDVNLRLPSGNFTDVVRSLLEEGKTRNIILLTSSTANEGDLTPDNRDYIEQLCRENQAQLAQLTKDGSDTWKHLAARMLKGEIKEKNKREKQVSQTAFSTNLLHRLIDKIKSL